MTDREFAVALLKWWETYQDTELRLYGEYERKAKERLPEFMDWLRQELEDE